MGGIIEILEVIADFVIVFGAAWIAFLFWRTYQRTSAVRSLWLSILFGLMALYFTAGIFVLDIFNISGFKWMEGHEALEFMLAIMIIALTVTLTVGASWKGTKLKPKKGNDQQKAA